MHKVKIKYNQVIDYLELILQHYQLDSDTCSQIIASFSQDKKSAFRVNTIKSTIPEVLSLVSRNNIGVEKVLWSDLSFVVDDKTSLSHLPEAKQGLFYIQNLSSQLTVQLLAPKPGEFVLDLAAAPGGKTGFIAQLMENSGRISAVEPVKERYYRLINNLRNLGVKIAKCYQKDGRVVGKLCHQWFDRVLLDAPCSSMAQIDLRDPDSYAHWSYKKVKECSKKQKQLIISAFESLKPGCEMIYSTCSWMVEENEEVVNHLLECYPEQVKILPLNLPIDNYLPGLTSYQGHDFDSQLGLSARVIPNARFEAFYLAKLYKI